MVSNVSGWSSPNLRRRASIVSRYSSSALIKRSWALYSLPNMFFTDSETHFDILIGALFSLGRQLLYFLKGDRPVVDSEIVKDAITVVIAAVAATQEQGASRINPL